MSFADRLDAAVGEVRNPCLVGIDSHLDLLPEEFAVARQPEAARAERAAALEAFGRELVELCAGRVAAVKPRAAFFELFGADGTRAWEGVARHALATVGRPHLLLNAARVPGSSPGNDAEGAVGVAGIREQAPE